MADFLRIVAGPVKWALLGLITAYRYTISPLLGPRCRFFPSCSEYMAQALTDFGVIRGLALGIRRVSRCHPWNEGGYDPVPAVAAREEHGEQTDKPDRGS